jgi:hypothetical protein
MYKRYGEIRRLAISTAVKSPETYEELVDLFDTHQQLFVFNTTGKALKMFEELKKRYDEKIVSFCHLLYVRNISPIQFWKSKNG